MRNKSVNHDIDFVITYVDGNDINWQREKNNYTPGGTSDINPNRYREWNNLQYLFRGIEEFAPWVRKVHFVTFGHLPKWLNTSNEKLHIVEHKDYIPKEWLPTFNNRCIELNLHRIPDLAEHFVYFNDDMFLSGEVTPEDFFKDGKPCDTAIIFANNIKMVNGIALHLAPIVDTAIINKYFDMRTVLKKDITKWLNIKYGLYNFMTLPLLMYHHFTGFLPLHLPYSYLKSTFETVWEKEPQICKSSCSHRFREVQDINQWLMNYWQFASGNFEPRNINAGKCFQLHTIENAVVAAKAVTSRRYKMVCLNDTIDEGQNFNDICGTVNSALDYILPKKSSFEL